MRTMQSLALVALVLVVVLTLVARPVAAQGRSVATVTVVNQRNVNIQVFDGTLPLSVRAGETRSFVLPGRGLRALRVRWNGPEHGELETEARLFESNRSWTLTINWDGTLNLDLRPPRS